MAASISTHEAEVDRSDVDAPVSPRRGSLHAAPKPSLPISEMRCGPMVQKNPSHKVSHEWLCCCKLEQRQIWHDVPHARCLGNNFAVPRSSAAGLLTDGPHAVRLTPIPLSGDQDPPACLCPSGASAADCRGGRRPVGRQPHRLRLPLWAPHPAVPPCPAWRPCMVQSDAADWHLLSRWFAVD